MFSAVGGMVAPDIIQKKTFVDGFGRNHALLQLR